MLKWHETRGQKQERRKYIAFWKTLFLASYEETIEDLNYKLTEVGDKTSIMVRWDCDFLHIPKVKERQARKQHVNFSSEVERIKAINVTNTHANNQDEDYEDLFAGYLQEH